MPLIGRAYHERIIGQTELVDRRQDAAHALIEPTGGGVERGHVVARLRRIRKRRRRPAKPRVVFRPRLGKLAVSERKAHRQEKRPGPVLQEAPRRRHPVGVGGPHVGKGVVVADHVRSGRDVLHAGYRSGVTVGLERVGEVSAVVARPEATVGQPQHAGRVRALPKQQRRPAGRARRGGAERLAKQHALLGESLQVGRCDCVAVGLDVSAGVVRVQVEDVRADHGESFIVGIHRSIMPSRMSGKIQKGAAMDFSVRKASDACRSRKPICAGVDGESYVLRQRMAAHASAGGIR